MLSGPNPVYAPLATVADRILRSMRPTLVEAMHKIESGAPLQDVLGELILTGYLAGQGMEPAGAAALITDLRTSYIRRVPLHHDIDGARRPELIRFLRKAMQDQTSAVLFYTELLSRTKEASWKEYVRHIRDDEQSHYRMLGNLYEDLTGETYETAPTQTEFEDLADGYKKAMDAEYEAFEEYRRIYLDYGDERIRSVFFELMTDELEHATRFNYLLQELAAAKKD